MRKFSGLSIYRKRGKKTAHAIKSHARSKLKNTRKTKETGTGEHIRKTQRRRACKWGVAALEPPMKQQQQPRTVTQQSY